MSTTPPASLQEMNFTAIIEKLTAQSAYTTGNRTNSFQSSLRERFSEAPTSEENCGFTGDSFQASRYSRDSFKYGDSNLSGDLPWLSIGPRSSEELNDRWISASLAKFVTNDLKELEIDSPPLRGGFSREYYSRLQVAELDLSFVVSRARASIQADQLEDETEISYSVDESTLSELWALLVCIKLACVTKARRWANLHHFAELWRGTEKCLFKSTTQKRTPDYHTAENNNLLCNVNNSRECESDNGGPLDETPKNSTERKNKSTHRSVQRTKSQ